MQYSLIYRKPETNGVLEACKEAGVTLVAYSPLCQGLLTGGWVGGCLVWWWSVGEGVGCRVGCAGCGVPPLAMSPFLCTNCPLTAPTAP